MRFIFIGTCPNVELILALSVPSGLSQLILRHHPVHGNSGHVVVVRGNGGPVITAEECCGVLDTSLYPVSCGPLNNCCTRTLLLELLLEAGSGRGVSESR